MTAFVLNRKIEENELFDAVKTAGIDNINEYIKMTTYLIVPIYSKIFQIFFINSVFSNEWLTCVIKNS